MKNMQLFSDIDSLMSLFIYFMRIDQQAEDENIFKKTTNNQLNKNIPTGEFLPVGHP